MDRTDVRRRSDAERSRQTRERIMQAAVGCLLDEGYAATSIGAIQKRAGVSRGALLHQYPSKTGLLVDAVRHLSIRQLEQIEVDASPHLDGAAWLEELWRCFDTPLFEALLELWVAARTDDELREALLLHQGELRQRVQSISRNHFGEQLPKGFDAVVELSLVCFRGLALTGIISASRRDQALSDWFAIVRQTLRE
jgi:AcrR family transcriptional regulator